jgi:lipoprotein-releasing system permease protein
MSRLPFELLLAFRYLRPKRTFVSVITLISILGVMLGVAVLIVVISVMTGFDRQLRDRILGFNAHLRIYSDAPIKDYSELVDFVSSNELVRGTAPFVIGRVMVRTQPEIGSSRTDAPYIRGIDSKTEARVTVLPEKMIDGEFDVRGNGILIGTNFAWRMGLGVGDKLLIYSIRDLEKMERNYKEGKEEGVLADEYEVRGIFDVGYFEFNNDWIVCSLGNAQDLYGLDDAIHGLIVMLRDPALAQQVKANLGPHLSDRLRISTWEDENSDILDALIVEKNVMTFILFFIIIVAAFGIMSVLITFVVQKTREIGMLKALGATRGQIMWLFLSQSLVVGVLGVIAGFGLGMLALSYRNEFLEFLRRVTGFELFPASIYGFRELPAMIDPRDIAIICGCSLLISLLAGFMPAWNAGRLKPVEALRYE